MPDIHERLNKARTADQMKEFLQNLAPYEVGLVCTWLVQDRLPVQTSGTGSGSKRTLVPFFILTCLVDRIRATTRPAVKEIYERRGPVNTFGKNALPAWTAKDDGARKLVTGGAVAKMLLHATDPVKLFDIACLICPPKQQRQQAGTSFYKVFLIVKIAHTQSLNVQKQLNAEYATKYDEYLTSPGEF